MPQGTGQSKRNSDPLPARSPHVIPRAVLGGLVAYIRKTPAGRWRVEIERAGVRTSETFDTKAAATAWGTQEEAAILAGTRGNFPSRTVQQALTRYELEVSKDKRGRRSEALRFAALARDFPALAGTVMHQVTTPDLVKWRDTRLKVVSKGSVQRDINLLRNVWTVAAREWKWCAEPSPWRGMRMPGDNPPRTQRVDWRSIRTLLRWFGYRTGQPPRTKQQEVGWAFLVSLRTALRAGEIMGMSTTSVDLVRGVVTLDQHKTSTIDGVRRVPLTRHGLRLLRVLAAGKTGPLWTVKGPSLDTLFRRARDGLGLDAIHFHDARAEALTLLSRRVDVMTLARISGHRDLRTLMDSYYRETAESISARL